MDRGLSEPKLFRTGKFEPANSRIHIQSRPSIYNSYRFKRSILEQTESEPEATVLVCSQSEHESTNVTDAMKHRGSLAIAE